MSLKHKTSFVKPNDVSNDRFLGKKLEILQPKKGFRAGIDSVLLGASVVRGVKKLADFGAGVGVASFCALKNNAGLSATLIENNLDMLELAKENIVKNGFEGRSETLELDLTSQGKVRQIAGLKNNYFDCIIANPPFFDMAKGSLAKGKARADARQMDFENLEKWVKTAASCAASGGEVIFIFHVSGFLPLLNAFEGRFGNIDILPIISKEGQDAKRFLLRGIKGSKAPLKIKSPLVLHAKEGREFLPQVEAIFRGEDVLHW